MGKINMTPHDWRELGHFLSSVSDSFIDSATEWAIFKQILDRTIHYSKFYEWFIKEHFYEGCLNLHGYPGILRSKSQIDRAFVILRKKGVVVIESAGGRKSMSFNVPGIIDFYFGTIKRVWKNKLPHTPFRDRIVGLNGIKAKVAFVFENRGCAPIAIACKKEKVMKLEDVMKRSLDDMAIAERKRNEKTKTKPLTARRAVSFFKQQARFYEVAYDDDESLQDPGKVLGMGKNWIAECEKDGMDLRKLIVLICRNYSFLRKDVDKLRTKKHDVCFYLAYIFRHEIIESLDNNLSDEEEEEIERL